MTPTIAAGLILLSTTSGIQDVGPVPSSPVASHGYFPFLDANRPQRSLGLFAGGGSFERFTPDRSARYALLEFWMPANAPVLILLAHDHRMLLVIRQIGRASNHK